MTKRFGFTLAEVLITLGIIGVVAAMTIPTLVKNYQKTVWVNQLKKSVSTIEQGFQKMMADDGVTKLEDTELGLLLLNENFGRGWGYSDMCTTEEINTVNDILKKYFNIVKFGDKRFCKDFLMKDADQEKCWDGDTAYPIYLTDGTAIAFEYLFSPVLKQLHDYYGDILIDVNGDKGPNQWGRDAFAFKVTKQGLINSYNAGIYGCKNPGEAVSEEAAGYDCAARIIKAGWKMDY